VQKYDRLTDCKGGGTDQEIGRMRVYRGCGDRMVVVFYTHDHCTVRPIEAAVMVPMIMVVVVVVVVEMVVGGGGNECRSVYMHAKI